MDSNKQHHGNSSELHKSSSLAKSYAAQPTSEWHSVCLRGTQLDGIHAAKQYIKRSAFRLMQSNRGLF